MGELLFADAIHIQKQSQIDAARITQKSGNELRASNTTLQQFSASLGNKRRMEAAGAVVNDIAGNSARLSRSLTSRRLSDRVRAAEELGAVAAMASAAGVGGSSIDVYKETLALHGAMQEAAVERAMGEQEWASGEQRGNAIKAAVAGLDNNNYRANIDYTQYVDHKKPSFLEQTVGIAATVAATVYGGPQAGAAVMGIFEARQAGRNGDLGAATAAINGAIRNGMNATRSANSTSPGPNADTPVEESSGLGGAVRNTPRVTQAQISSVTSAERDFSQPFFNLPAIQLGSIQLK